MENVNRVIQWLRTSTLEEGAVVDDPELNRLLDRYRVTYPIEYRCEGDRCRTTIAYWAIASSGARIVPAPSRTAKLDRDAGEYPNYLNPRPGRPQVGERVVTGGDADLEFPDFGWQGRFELPIEWAMQDQSAINLATNPTVGSGWPLRWRFTCPKCRRAYVYTNRQMLTLFLQAIAARRTWIRPGRLR